MWWSRHWGDETQNKRMVDAVGVMSEATIRKEVLDGYAARGMGAYLGVSQGSAPEHAAQFIHLHYTPEGARAVSPRRWRGRRVRRRRRIWRRRCVRLTFTRALAVAKQVAVAGAAAVAGFFLVASIAVNSAFITA